MKRKWILVLLAALLFLGTAGAAGADVRLDFDIPVLLAAHLNVSDFAGSGTSLNLDLSGMHIPLPYVMLAYQSGDGFFRWGIGVRTYTVLVEFLGWPIGYVELEFDRLILRGEIGGIGIFALGIANSFTVQSVLFPDVQLSYAVTPWFRLGAGVLMATPAGSGGYFGWLFYVNARFALSFK